MKRAWSRRIAFSFTSACGLLTVISGQIQAKPAPPVPARRQPAHHRATVAMGHENQAGIQADESDFTRPNQLAFPPLANRSSMKSSSEVSRAGVPFLDQASVMEAGVEFLLPNRADGARDEDLAALPQLELAHKAFDLEVFGSTGDAETARDFMKGLLSNKISQSQGKHRWSPLEKKKLELAGHGDIKRLLDRIEEERKTLEHVPIAPDQTREVLLRLRSLRLQIRRGPFGAGSLFVKTLKKIRDDQNLVRRKAGLEAHVPSL